MSLARIKSHLWSNKRQVNKPLFYTTSLLVAAFFAFVRIRPYLEGKRVTIVFGHEKKAAISQKSSQTQDPHHSNDSKNGFTANHGGRPTGFNAPASAQYLIERPLFDGKMVSLQGVLLQTLSSNQPANTVEVAIVGGDTSGAFDQTVLQGAKLIGSAGPNFDSKRYTFQFSQLILENGKRYRVVGYAYDEGSHFAGISADYSSGLATRLAGATLGRAIQVSEDLLAAQAFKSTGNDNVASNEINRNLMNTSQQAGTSISQEATKDLVSTKSELSLKAGTVFWLRLQATPSSQGGARE